MNGKLVNTTAERLAQIKNNRALATEIAALPADLKSYVEVRLREIGRTDVGFSYYWGHIIHNINSRFVPGDKILYRGKVARVEWVQQGLTEIEYMTQRFGLVRDSWVKEV